MRDLSELRSFVQDRPGGGDVLFPALQESDLPYTLRDLQRVLHRLSEENVDALVLFAQTHEGGRDSLCDAARDAGLHASRWAVEGFLSDMREKAFAI